MPKECGSYYYPVADNGTCLPIVITNNPYYYTYSIHKTEKKKKDIVKKESKKERKRVKGKKKEKGSKETKESKKTGKSKQKQEQVL